MTSNQASTANPNGHGAAGEGVVRCRRPPRRPLSARLYQQIKALDHAEPRNRASGSRARSFPARSNWRPATRSVREPCAKRSTNWPPITCWCAAIFGLPTLVADVLPEGREIVLQSENGVLGVGPAPGANEIDLDLVNAGKQPVTLLTGGSYVHHTDSFLMIRGGHLDLALLGAFEVAENGDLANWTTDDPTFPPGVGGAMDLAVGAKEIRVLVEHMTRDGAPRLRKHCHYPLTASRVVRRIYTDFAVIDVTARGFVVREMVEDIDFDSLQQKTEATLHKAADLKGAEGAGGLKLAAIAEVGGGPRPVGHDFRRNRTRSSTLSRSRWRRCFSSPASRPCSTSSRPGSLASPIRLMRRPRRSSVPMPVRRSS